MITARSRLPGYIYQGGESVVSCANWHMSYLIT